MLLAANVLFVDFFLCCLINALLNVEDNEMYVIIFFLIIASVFIIVLGMRLVYSLFARSDYIFEDRQMSIHHCIFERIRGKSHNIQIAEPSYYFAQCKRRSTGKRLGSTGQRLGFFSQQYDELMSFSSLSYSVMLLSKNEKTTLFMSCYKSKAEEFIEQLQLCYPSIKGVTSEGYLLEPNRQLEFYNAASLEEGLAKSNAKTSKVFAGFMAFFFLAIAAMGFFGVNQETNALDSPPKESGWVQTKGKLIKTQCPSSTSKRVEYNYGLVYHWAGKRYHTHCLQSYSDIEKSSNGVPHLYVNPKKPSKYSFHLDSREDIQNRVYLYTMIMIIAFLLSISLMIVMIRNWRKLATYR